MQLTELIDAALRGRSDSPALDLPGGDGDVETLSFGDIERRSRNLAAMLRREGFVAGDRLAFFLQNSVEVIDIFLACARAGVVVVPINILYRETELEHIIADAAPKALICSAADAAMIPDETCVWTVEGLAALSENGGAFDPPPLKNDDPLMIVYTSGTTGRSKGAVITRGNYAFNAETLTDAWRVTADDRYLAVLPLFHVHGLGNGVGCWLASGCRMYLAPRFDAEMIESQFLQFSPTLFFGVPTVYRRLLELSDEAARGIGERMRLFVSGSAPLPAEVFESFEMKFGHRVLERYGMSETMMNIANPYVGERRPGSVGFPLPGVEVRIVDLEFNEVPDGETGELLIRGPNVFSGYWQNPGATEEAFHDGWFRSGDLGSRAADGYIKLSGRRSELIISGGFNVYPREIEEALLRLPGVSDAAVRGVADRRRGEIPVAFVVATEEFDEGRARERLLASMASFKVPRQFVRVGSLPRNALGKVQKHLLPLPSERV